MKVTETGSAIAQDAYAAALLGQRGHKAVHMVEIWIAYRKDPVVLRASSAEESAAIHAEFTQGLIGGRGIVIDTVGGRWLFAAAHVVAVRAFETLDPACRPAATTG